MCANILPHIHANKFCPSVRSSVRPCVYMHMATIYVHLERSARIDRNDAPGTHVITNRSCNEPFYSIKEYEIVVEKKRNILNTHAGITGNSAEFGGSNSEVRIIATLLLLPRVFFF